MMVKLKFQAGEIMLMLPGYVRQTIQHDVRSHLVKVGNLIFSEIMSWFFANTEKEIP